MQVTPEQILNNQDEYSPEEKLIHLTDYLNALAEPPTASTVEAIKTISSVFATDVSQTKGESQYNFGDACERVSKMCTLMDLQKFAKLNALAGGTKWRAISQMGYSKPIEKIVA